MKYVLTGTTGGLGSRVFKHLLDFVPASDVIVSMYNPAGAPAHIVNTGVEIRRGDYSQPSTLDTAFAGADKLLIISSPSIAYEQRVKNHVAAINAAKRCGVSHIYYTSLAFASDSVAAVMRAHLDTEAYLRQSGMTYTIIREGIYSESFPLYFGFFDPAEGASDVLVPHSDGGIAWVCRDNLGEGTAKVMAALSGYENKLLLFTGSKTLTLKDLASLISHILNREPPISLRIVSEDEYVSHVAARTKQSEELLHAWATTYKALARGELNVVDPLLRNLLGRELKPMEETLREMLLGSKEAGSSALKQYAK